MDVEAKVKDIIERQLSVEPGKVQLNSLIVDDLGADSLDSVELVIALEEEFGIEIPDEDAERMVRIRDSEGLILYSMAPLFSASLATSILS